MQGKVLTYDEDKKHHLVVLENPEDPEGEPVGQKTEKFSKQEGKHLTLAQEYVQEHVEVSTACSSISCALVLIDRDC